MLHLTTYFIETLIPIACSLIALLISFYSAFITFRYFKDRKEYITKLNKDKFRIILYRSIGQKERFKYYEYLREEVDREDEIQNQRVMWCVTFQGFLISGLAVLLVFPWDVPPDILLLRRLAIFGVGTFGLLLALAALMGIIASRFSIDSVRAQWEDRNAIWKLFPHLVPQAYGQKGAFRGGRLYALFLPLIFIFMWVALIGIYSLLYLQTLSEKCNSPELLLHFRGVWVIRDFLLYYC